MAALFHRTGGPTLENEFSYCAYHDCGLPLGCALWAARRRVCLLGNDDIVAHSAPYVGSARYSDLSSGYSAGPHQPAGLRYRSCRNHFCGTVILRAIVASFASPCARNRLSFRHILWDALIRNRTEIFLYGTPA